MVHKIHLWISEMYYVLFNGFPEHRNAGCLPPNFELNLADRELHLEPLLFIRGDAINLSLWLHIEALRITEAPDCSFCVRSREADLKLQLLVSGRLCCPVTVVFGCSFH